MKNNNELIDLGNKNNLMKGRDIMNIKNTFNKVTTKANAFRTAVVIGMLSTPVYASGTSGAPILVTGALKMIEDATGWAMMALPAVAIVMGIIEAVKMAMCDNSHEKTEHIKKIKGIGISLAIGLSATSLVYWVAGYFGG